jgi:hypothetical protein
LQYLSTDHIRMPAFAFVLNYSVELRKMNIVVQTDVCNLYSNLRGDFSDVDRSHYL